MFFADCKLNPRSNFDLVSWHLGCIGEQNSPDKHNLQILSRTSGIICYGGDGCDNNKKAKRDRDNQHHNTFKTIFQFFFLIIFVVLLVRAASAIVISGRALFTTIVTPLLSSFSQSILSSNVFICLFILKSRIWSKFTYSLNNRNKIFTKFRFETTLRGQHIVLLCLVVIYRFVFCFLVCLFSTSKCIDYFRLNSMFRSKIKFCVIV